MSNSLILVFLIAIGLVVLFIIYCLIKKPIKQLVYKIQLKIKKRFLLNQIKVVAEELLKMSFSNPDINTFFYTIRNNLLDDIKPFEQSGKQMSRAIFRISKNAEEEPKRFKPDQLKHIQKRLLDINFIIDEAIQLEKKIQ